DALPISRADTRAAAGDRADREEASAARADGCAAPVRGGRGSTHNVRVRDDRRIQRRTRARTRPGHADPRVPLAREPDSLQPDPGPGLKTSKPAAMQRFQRVLEDSGIAATIRTPRGKDIAAACGQLRAEHAVKPPRPYVELTRRRKMEEV